jgi:hypothetical protein
MPVDPALADGLAGVPNYACAALNNYFLVEACFASHRVLYFFLNATDTMKKLFAKILWV